MQACQHKQNRRALADSLSSINFTPCSMVPFDTHLLHCKMTLKSYFSDRNINVFCAKQIQDYLDYFKNAFPDLQPFSS